MIAVDPVRDRDERHVRLTESEALANVRTVLELCSAGELRCSDKTNRPTAATIRTLTPTSCTVISMPRNALPPSPGRCWSKLADWPNWTARDCN
jgi:hypothetical protein